MTFEGQPVEALVEQALDGSQEAWNAIVDRYASLVWKVCRSFHLSDADSADVSQSVWLRTVERLSSLRVPAALPGWLTTTTRNECLKILAQKQRGPVPSEHLSEEATGPEAELDAHLLSAERQAMVREAFAQLPEHCQRLLSLLVGVEPRTYAEISAELNMSVGSIGPTRARCLDKLRGCPSVVTLLATDYPEEGGHDGHA